jgi:hypothetical protein
LDDNLSGNLSLNSAGKGIAKAENEYGSLEWAGGWQSEDVECD